MPAKLSKLYPTSPLDPSEYDRSTWGKRADGTPKGLGFLGPLRRPDGGLSSELSIEVGIDGKQIEIPSMVPTLNKKEVEWLLTTPDDQQAAIMPKSIQDKAAAWAIKRMKQGKPVFRQDDEPYPGRAR